MNFISTTDSFSLKFDYNNTEEFISTLKHAQEHLKHIALNELYGKTNNNDDQVAEEQEEIEIDCSSFDRYHSKY